MADPRLVHPLLNPRFQANPTNRSKSCSHFLLKFLLVGFFLSLIPLFPTEAPGFISHTIFAQAWELIHLFVIGIALSYGLFCRLKSPELSPKPQISQPYVANMLHHSSLFDYENENPSGNLEKDAIPTQSCNFSYYRTEPFVVERRENSQNFYERPLGLPVRSLRSRIVESDSSDSDGEEDCESGCESDLSGKSSGNNYSGTRASGKDQNLEDNVANLSQMSWKSRSTRMDFMTENGKFEMNRLNSQSFRPPTQGSCQRNYGFCCWLPESPNMQHNPMGMPQFGRSSVEGGNSWRRENFEMPVCGFSTQGYGSNDMDISPNLEKGNLGWEEGKFYVPSTGAPLSMAAPNCDFGSRSRRCSQERVNLGEPSSLENGNFSIEKTGFFMPSSAAVPSVSVPDTDFALSIKPSRSRKYNNEIGDLGISPDFEHGNLGGEKTDLFMPSAAAAAALSLSVPEQDFSSAFKSSWPNRSKHENGDLGISPSFEHENQGGEKTNLFMPSATAAPSLSVPEEDFSSAFKSSWPNTSTHEIGDLGISPNFEHGTLGCEGTSFPMLSAGAVSSTSVPDRSFTLSIKSSRSRKFSNEIGHLGISPNFEHVNLGIEKISSFMPATAVPSPVSAPKKDFGSSMKGSRHLKINDDNGDLGKSPTQESGNFIGEKTSSFMHSAAEASPLSAPVKDISSSIQRSRSRKSSHENWNQGKSPNLEKENLGDEKINSFVPPAADPSSVSTPEKGFGLSRSQGIHHSTSSKDDEESDKYNVGSFGEGDDSSSPHCADPLSVPTPRNDFASSIDGPFVKKDDQRSVPVKWDDDCFVILPSENDMGNVDQENLSHGLAHSSKPPSSAGSISRRASSEQMSPQSKVEESVSVSASANSSETEELGGDHDAYKPSTPSPPPQVQTQRNDIPSSVESSPNALGNGFLLDDHDELGSPPTPGSGKSLLKTSHSRRFSCGSFFDREQRRGSKDDHTKEANQKIAKRGSSCGWDCLKLDVKPTLMKATLKGKSVRTIKPREIPPDTGREPPQGEEQREENGGPLMERTEERKGEKPGMVVIQIGISEKRPNSSSGRSGDQNQGSGTTSIILGLNKDSTRVNATDVKGEETDNDEINRKADEFIAKFKEQMRLQKVATRAESSSTRQQPPRRNSQWRS